MSSSSRLLSRRDLLLLLLLLDEEPEPDLESCRLLLLRRSLDLDRDRDLRRLTSEEGVWAFSPSGKSLLGLPSRLASCCCCCWCWCWCCCCSLSSRRAGSSPPLLRFLSDVASLWPTVGPSLTRVSSLCSCRQYAEYSCPLDPASSLRSPLYALSPCGSPRDPGSLGALGGAEESLCPLRDAEDLPSSPGDVDSPCSLRDADSPGCLRDADSPCSLRDADSPCSLPDADSPGRLPDAAVSPVASSLPGAESPCSPPDAADAPDASSP